MNELEQQIKKIRESKPTEEVQKHFNERILLHFVDGEKGGVGKSLFSSILYEWYEKHEFTIKLIDTDRSNPDVGLTYANEEYEQYLYSDNESQIFFAGDISSENNYGKADEIVNNLSEDYTGDVLVNLPASVGTYFNEWLEVCLEESLKKEEYSEINNVYIIRWWVTDGTASSLDLLEETIDKYPYLPYVVVLNGINGMTANEFVETNIGKKMLANKFSANISFIEIPKLSLSEKEMNYLKKNHISFKKAIEGGDVKVLTRQRLKTFVNKCFLSVDQILSTKMTLQERYQKDIDLNF